MSSQLTWWKRELWSHHLLLEESLRHHRMSLSHHVGEESELVALHAGNLKRPREEID
jgi:hypothetical protein